MTRCLITGCRLIDEGQARHAWGDLHLVSNGVLVFNAVLHEGETKWEFGIDPMRLPLGEKRVILPASTPYFERRGVIVFSEWQTKFNILAERHMREDPDERS